MKPLRLLLLLCSTLLLAPAVAAAQPAPAPLQGFVASVARTWAAGDAGALAALAPRDDRILLDLGAGRAEAVEARHAAAALRDLFRDRSTLSARAAQVTLAGGDPPSGFGEITWSSRARGVSDTETVTVYVGAVWEASGWKLRELRVLR